MKKGENQKHYFADTAEDVVAEGIAGINFVLEKVNEKFFSGEQSMRPTPMVIYRGVTSYYPRRIKGVEDNGEEVIQSSLAYRLQEFCKDGYNRSTYIRKLKRIISDARMSFPKEYSDNLSDLEVLADIQHNGGATCLVDFSKNILKALWFACEREEDEDGYLYCYNIMDDSIINNNLTWVKNQEKRDIESLLTASSRFANVCSDVTNRFYYWTPPAVNNRIVTQDSIFIFGLDKFEVKKHNIYTFRIKKEVKVSIKRALEMFFNIHSFSIYNDIPGFARSKHRSNPFAQNGTENFNGMFADMLKYMQGGDYTSASALIRQYQVQKKNMDSLENMELHYSLAVCFMKSTERAEFDVVNSIQEFRSVITLCDEIIKKDRKKIKGEQDKNKVLYLKEEIEYVSRKGVRAYNEIIDLCYESRRYQLGIEICDEIIKKNNNHVYTFEGNEVLNPCICRIVRMELLVIGHLSGSIYWDSHSVSNESISPEALNTKNALDKILIQYYKVFDEIYQACINDSGILECEKKVAAFKKTIDTAELESYSESYYYWEFLDILSALSSLDVKNNKIALPYINSLKDLTSAIIFFRDKLESLVMTKDERV